MEQRSREIFHPTDKTHKGKMVARFLNTCMHACIIIYTRLHDNYLLYIIQKFCHYGGNVASY